MLSLIRWLFLLLFLFLLPRQIKASENIKRHRVGIYLKTGPFIAFNHENILNEGWNFLPTVRQDAIGISFGLYKRIHFGIEYNHKAFKGELKNYSDDLIAKQRAIYFNDLAFDLNLRWKYFVLHSGIDIYILDEKINGVTEFGMNELQMKTHFHRNTGTGCHLGYTLKCPISNENITIEPFVELNDIFVFGVYKGIYEDYYMKWGRSVFWGILIITNI